ncbi:MAG: hypothetical protein ABIW38_04260, partial [Ferruginibacter sp.]
ILIEAWGAGGGGNYFGSGAGGGYASAHFGVNPGAVVTITVGNGGTNAGNANAGSGGTTTLALPDSLGANYTVYATGGQGAYFSGSLIFSPTGGSFTINPGYYNFKGEEGRNGASNEYFYVEKTAGVFIEIVKASKGGDAANSFNSGGLGCTYVPSVKTGQAASGLRPGGGGGGGALAAGTNGGYGGAGYVIIRY